METINQEAIWHVKVQLNVFRLKNAELNDSDFISAIQTVLKTNTWLSANGTKPVKIRVYKSGRFQDKFHFYLDRTLKTSQLYAFQQYIGRVLEKIILSRVPGLSFIDSQVELTGRSITRGIKE